MLFIAIMLWVGLNEFRKMEKRFADFKIKTIPAIEYYRAPAEPWYYSIRADLKLEKVQDNIFHCLDENNLL